MARTTKTATSSELRHDAPSPKGTTLFALLPLKLLSNHKWTNHKRVNHKKAAILPDLRLYYTFLPLGATGFRQSLPKADRDSAFFAKLA